MNKKLNFLLFSILILSVVRTNPAQAIENGSDDLNNKRVVSIFKGSYPEIATLTCSGFLFSPNIVFSVAHCFHGPEAGTNDFFVTEPGIEVNPLSPKVKVVDKLIPSDFENINYNNDFAILILEKSISELPPAKIISIEKINELIKIKSEIKISGYGLQSNACFEYAPTCIGISGLGNKRARLDMPRKPKSIDSTLSLEVNLNNKVDIFKPNGLEVYAQFSDGTSICSGDSGGPNTILIDGEEFYVGASSRVASSNACGMGMPKPGGGYSTFYPAANYQDLIDQSIKTARYLDKLAKKMPRSILCLKGKIEKIVKSKNPKCPAGFKQTSIENAKANEANPCPEIGKISGNLTCVASDGKKIWFKLTIDQSFNGQPIIGTRCYRDGVITKGYNKEKENITIVCTFREAGAFPKWLDL